MPTPGPKGALFPNTYLAGTAIVRGRVVTRGADANHCVQAGVNAVSLGIAEDHQATAERQLRVADRPGELTWGEAGAAFAIDVRLAADANGRLILATIGQNVAAISRQAAAALGDLVSVEIPARLTTAP